MAELTKIEQLTVPDRIKTDLTNCLAELKTKYGDNLHSVFIFGSVARNEYYENTSNINVLIILKNASIQEINKSAPMLKELLHKSLIIPFIVSLSELKQSTDVLPIKFLDIKENYKILYGEDVLKELPIEREHLRLNAEMELKVMLFKMRQAFIKNYGNPVPLHNVVLKIFNSFLYPLRTLIELKGEPISLNREEIIKKGAELFKLNAACLNQFLDLKKTGNKIQEAQLTKLYEDFTEVLNKTADVADSL